MCPKKTTIQFIGCFTLRLESMATHAWWESPLSTSCVFQCTLGWHANFICYVYIFDTMGKATKRIHKKRWKRKNEGDANESSWLRKRRRLVTSVVTNSSTSAGRRSDVVHAQNFSNTCWTREQSKEAALQKKRVHANSAYLSCLISI